VFVYDKVFRPNATQESVYDMVAKPIVKGNMYFVILNFTFMSSFEFYCVMDDFKIYN